MNLGTRPNADAVPRPQIRWCCVASRATALVTAVGLGIEGVTYVEIHHDRANEVSGRILVRRGYHHVATVRRDREAPGTSGTRCTGG